jgi:hypothetical protein
MITKQRVFAFATLSLCAACNSLIGVDDVSAIPPDAPAQASAPPCDVAPSISLVASNPKTSTLTRTNGSPNASIVITTAPLLNGFGFFLTDNQGGHGALDAVGTYPLLAGDAILDTCGICAFVLADVNNADSTQTQTYFAHAQGTLKLTKADATGLTGEFTNLVLRHVDGSVDDPDGCVTQIDEVLFDLPYATPTQ